MKLTLKEKKFLKTLMQSGSFLQALDYNYDDDNEKEFVKEHNINFKEAEDIIESIIKKL